ncbi:MAG: hypothetical protein JEY99_00575 [Spirochaetales bacterium]|nr:hypothetical protein [Spirochaetales bacterium]
MIRTGFLSIVTLCIFVIPSVFLFSLDDREETPDWLMIERGRQAIIDRELGDALRIFRSILGNAANEGRMVPEAEMWLGYIFEQEGETELAVQQYNRALDHADILYVMEDKYTILYRLANLYEAIYQYGKYETLLKRIITEGSADEVEPEASLIYLQEAMFNALMRDGIDKLFILYRKNEKKLQPAYSKLGLYHYKTGLYREAVRNYISSLITPVTNVVDYQRNLDFTYEYTTLSEFLFDSLSDPVLSDYLEEVGFVQDLYYLGASLFGTGNTGMSREIWMAILHSAPDSTWKERANRQLTDPFIEPLLIPSKYE